MQVKETLTSYEKELLIALPTFPDVFTSIFETILVKLRNSGVRVTTLVLSSFNRDISTIFSKYGGS